MPDVVILDQQRRELIRALASQRPEPSPHSEGRRVGVMGTHMQCQTCGTVCVPLHEPITVTDTETGEDRVIPGAWVDSDGLAGRHLFPFQTHPQDNTDAQPTTPSPRPAGIPDDAIRRKHGEARAALPSRSPEARRAERERRLRRQRA